MKLAKEIIEFQHRDLIKEMRRLSAIQKGRMSGYVPPTAWMTRYGFGRQSGSTEAIVQTAIDDRHNDETTVIIVHDNAMAKMVSEMVRAKTSPMDPSPTRVVVFNVHAGLNPTTKDKFKGLRIDHVLVDGCVTRIDGWRRYIDGLVNEPTFSRVKDIVMIGS